MPTAVASESNVLFLKLAIVAKVLTKADAQRILKVLKQAEGLSAGSLAVDLGLLSPSQRTKLEEKVARRLARRADGVVDSQSGSGEKRVKSDSKIAKAKSDPEPKSDSKIAKAKSDPEAKRAKKKTETRKDKRPEGSPKRRRRSEAPPLRKKSSPIPIVAAALAAGLLVGVGGMFAMKSDTPAPVVAKGDEPQPETPPEASPAVEPTKTKDISGALDFAISSSSKLRELKKEKAALQILDEFLTEHGDVHRVSAARKALVEHCHAVLGETRAEATRLAKRGDTVQAAHMIANLRRRLPASMLPKVNALAVELEGAESPAPKKPEPQIAQAEPADEIVLPAPSEPVAAKPVEEPVAEVPAEVPAAKEPVAKEPAVAGEEDDEEVGLPQQPSSEQDGDELDPAIAGAAVDKDSPLALALAEVVHVPHTLRKSGELTVSYPMQEGLELEDFESRGFDKFEVRNMDGVSMVYRMGLECGVGSQRRARFRHCVPLDGDFEIETELWLNYSNTRTQLLFQVGEKYGVSWGQQLVKVSKRGNMKALSQRPDPTMFREERLVKVKMTYKDGLFTVRCNGKKTAEKKLKPNDMRGHFSVTAKDVRLQITNLTIKGTVDAGEI